MHDLDPGSPDFPADVANGLPDHPAAALEFDIVRTEQPPAAGEPADEIIVPGAGRRYERAAPADTPANDVERLGSLSTANEVQVEQPDPAAEARQDEASPASPDYSEAMAADDGISADSEAESPAAGGDAGGGQPPTDETPPGPAEPGDEGDGEEPEQPDEAADSARGEPATEATIEADEAPAPTFVKAKQLQEQLGLPDNGPSRLRPHMFTLVLGDKTYRFPEQYLNAYAGFINETGGMEEPNLPEGLRPALGNRMSQVKPGSPAAAKYFATTEQAGEIIESVKAGFEAALQRITDPVRPDCVKAEQFAELVGVNEQTIDGWRVAGLKVLYGEGTRRVIPLHALREFCRWQDPRPAPEE